MSNAKVTNRFKGCNCPTALMVVWTKYPETLTFANLSDEEKETIFSVYSDACLNAVTGSMPTVNKPLTEAGYSIVIKTIESLCKAFGFIYEDMNKPGRDFFAVIDNLFASINSLLRGTKVHAGETVEGFRGRCDQSINSLKDSLNAVIELIGDATGCTSLVDACRNAVYVNLKGEPTRNSYDKCVNSLSKSVDKYIKSLLVNPDEVALKQVIKLRYVLGKDEKGNDIVGHQSIFSAAIKGVVWVVRKFLRKLNDWGITSTDAEKNLFGTVGAAIAGVFKFVAGVVYNIANIVINAVIIVASHVVGAIICAIAWVTEKLLAGWDAIAKKRISKKEELEDIEIPDFDAI